MCCCVHLGVLFLSSMDGITRFVVKILALVRLYYKAETVRQTWISLVLDYVDSLALKMLKFSAQSWTTLTQCQQPKSRTGGGGDLTGFENIFFFRQ